jgi:hypothetical protein
LKEKIKGISQNAKKYKEISGHGYATNCVHERAFKGNGEKLKKVR